MDWVASRQIHSKKILEKELSELETKQRITEAKRLKQIRDLGVDLSKLQRSTRDLDEIIDDIKPKRQDRRSSLPALNNSGGLTYYVDGARSPRSKRRLSSIAAFTGRDNPESAGDSSDRSYGDMTQDKDKQRRGSNTGLGQRRGSKTDSLPLSARGDKSSPMPRVSDTGEYKGTPRPTTRRKSVDNGLEGSSGKNGPDHQSHHTTAVVIHSEDDGSASNAHSMFSRAAGRTRRSSEPAVGGYYIRGLQDLMFGDVPPLDLAEAEEVKKSIRKNLPSDIVAEQDEDEEEEEEAAAAAAKGQTTSASGATLSANGARKKEKLSSISEGDQEEQNNSAKSDRKATSDKTKYGSAKKNGDKSSYTPARPRRKSEGDVLKFAKVWKLRVDSKHAAAAKDLASALYDSTLEEHNATDEMWDAVRKCRYIRGYEPPEMRTPADIGEFVFGHRNQAAVPPEKPLNS